MMHLPEEIDVLFQEWLARNVDQRKLDTYTGRSLLKLAFAAGYDARMLPSYAQYGPVSRENGGNPGYEAVTEPETGLHRRPRAVTTTVHDPRTMPDAAFAASQPPGYAAPGLSRRLTALPEPFEHTETVYDDDGSADYTGFMPLPPPSRVTGRPRGPSGRR